MFNTVARTIAKRVSLVGLGLHGGRPARVTLHPAKLGHGCWFRTPSGRWPVRIEAAGAPGGQTRLGEVNTVEHLLAAVVGLGLTELEIEVEGGELPTLDGSAAPWVELLGDPVEVGNTEGFSVGEPIVVEGFGGWARWAPADELQLEVHLDFPWLKQSFAAGPDARSILQQVAGARTFLAHAELDAVHAAGLGRGVRPGGVVVWGQRGALVPLRHPDEPARHKMLDLLGDLALIGRPFDGTIEVYRGSHALHQALIRRCLERVPLPSRYD